MREQVAPTDEGWWRRRGRVADLRGVVPPHLWRRAVRQAELAGFDLGEIVGDGTRSDLELDFLRICRRVGLPAPEVNRYHRGRIAFQDDHAREAAVAADIAAALSIELPKWSPRRKPTHPSSS